jgi:hypothetical protein
MIIKKPATQSIHFWQMIPGFMQPKQSNKLNKKQYNIKKSV